MTISQVTFAKWANHIYKSKVKLATVEKEDSKAPFTITTTPKCRGRRNSFPWVDPLYPWSVPNNAVLSKETSSTIF